MKSLATYLRAMQIFTHNAHNLVARTPFHQDHEFFGSTYEEIDSDYDSVVERIIGLMGEQAVGFETQLQEIQAKLAQAPCCGIKENAAFYQHLLSMEKQLCDIIKQYIVQGVTPGTEQTIGAIAEKSEIRQYKINQRLKK